MVFYSWNTEDLQQFFHDFIYVHCEFVAVIHREESQRPAAVIADVKFIFLTRVVPVYFRFALEILYEDKHDAIQVLFDLFVICLA